jgi:hypothetical protein
VSRWLPYALLLLGPLIPPVQDALDRSADRRVRADVLYLWSPDQVRRVAPGFRSVLADIYWLRTVQYFGSQRAFSQDGRFDLLLPLIDITTTLDPRLEIAYRYGAIFLCEAWPNGKGDPQAGIALLEKGTRALPRSWRLRQDLGYFRYVFLNDAQGGARVLREAAALPGAPFWLEALAGSILAKSGDRQTAREIWTRMHEQAEAGPIKQNAALHLQRLDALDALSALNGQVEQFHAQHQRVPRDAGEVLATGARGIPLQDPTGVPFEYDPVQGRFWLSRQSRLWQRP